MSARKVTVELTGPQIDALIGAAVDADGNDMDCLPGDPRLQQQPIRARAVAALLAARAARAPTEGK